MNTIDQFEQLPTGCLKGRSEARPERESIFVPLPEVLSTVEEAGIVQFIANNGKAKVAFLGSIFPPSPNELTGKTEIIDQRLYARFLVKEETSKPEWQKKEIESYERALQIIQDQRITMEDIFKMTEGEMKYPDLEN